MFLGTGFSKMRLFFQFNKDLLWKKESIFWTYLLWMYPDVYHFLKIQFRRNIGKSISQKSPAHWTKYDGTMCLVDK